MPERTFERDGGSLLQLREVLLGNLDIQEIVILRRRSPRAAVAVAVLQPRGSGLQRARLFAVVLHGIQHVRQERPQLLRVGGLALLQEQPALQVHDLRVGSRSGSSGAGCC